MIVRELIDVLQKLDPDLEVQIWTEGQQYNATMASERAELKWTSQSSAIKSRLVETGRKIVVIE